MFETKIRKFYTGAIFLLLSLPLFAQFTVVSQDALSLLIYDSLDGLIRTAIETDGESPGEDEEFNFNEMYLNESWIIDVNIPGLYPFWDAIPMPTVLDITLGYRYLFLPGRPTSIFGNFGGGYTTHRSIRSMSGDPLGILSEEDYIASADYHGNYLPQDIVDEDDRYQDGYHTFNEVDAMWGFGVSQEILPRSEISDPSLVAYLLYRSTFEMYMEGFSWHVESVDREIEDFHNLYKDSVGFPDADGVMTNTLFAGIQLSWREDHPTHHYWQGIEGEVSLEWNPSSGEPFYMNMFGYNILLNPDFIRLSLNARGGYNFIDLQPEKKNNTFNIGLYGVLFVDWLYGSMIPQTVQQQFGGVDPDDRRFRGYEDLAFDTTLKLETDIELRMNLPAIVLTNLVPGLFGFIDIGYFHGWENSENYSDTGAFAVSAGGGVYVYIVFSYLSVSFEAPVYLSVNPADGYKIKVEGGFHF